MKHKGIFIALTVICTVILALVIFLTTWFWGDTYPDLESFSQEFEIPGLDEGAVPQGMTTYAGDEQYFMITAYFTDGTPSRVYVTGEDSGYIGYVSLKDESGEDFFGHVGGIAVSTDGKFMWIASGTMIYVVGGSSGTVEEIISLAQGETTNDEDGTSQTAEAVENTVTFTASFNSNLSEAAFVYYYDNPSYTANTYDKLFVGEFYKEGNYETDTKHHVTTPSGYENHAFMIQYRYDSSNTDYGLRKLSYSLTASVADEDNVPLMEAIYSIPDRIQGMAITSDKFVLSESYGLANSHLYTYTLGSTPSTSLVPNYSSTTSRSKLVDAIGSNLNYEGVYTTNGTQVTTGSAGLSTIYLYYIDDSFLETDYEIPSMAEGLCAVDDKVYVLFESGSNKYKKFVRQQMTEVFSITL